MKLNGDKISVIIPVYNIDKYLDRCLQSVTCQTYKNLEIILVDDGSTDRSSQICDEWTIKDNRIHCIHQANAGVSKARNCGLKCCTGDYILFVDGDDTIAPEMCEKLCKEMIDPSIDVSICGYYNVEGHSVEQCCSANKRILNTADLLEDIFYEKGSFSAVWNKMFRRSTLMKQSGNFVLFPDGIAVGEDQVWLIRVLKRCKKGIIIPECLYYWLRRSGSASYHQRAISKNYLTILDADESCIKEITFKKAKKIAYKKYIGDISNALWQAYQEKKNSAMNDLLLRYKQAKQLYYMRGAYSIQDMKIWMIKMKLSPSWIIRTWSLWKKMKGQNCQLDTVDRVSIITIYDINIGNRLQNYAVQNVLQGLGYLVATVRYPVEYRVTLKIQLKKIVHHLSGYRFSHGNVYWKTLNLRKARIKSFETFNNKHICEQKIRNLSQIKEADYYVLGSDQVWNPGWYSYNTLKKDLFLLSFTKPEKKICFAPSFGIEQLPEKWKPWFRKYLADIPKLSVRENSGAKIIKELTGKDACVMIDPTLMLDRDQWNEISVKPTKINTNQPYILTYFLGGRSDETERSIKQYAEQMHALVYHLVDPEQPDMYVTGPSEFLYLVAHAKLVLTDSFHACVFSFLYGKPFLVYNRQDDSGMMSRIETMLKKFQLERKYAASGLENDLLECDYQSGYEILKGERKKALHFLKVSMKMEAE